METTTGVPRDIVDRFPAESEAEVYHECQTRNCNARSFYFATVNGTELSYCGHHGTEYEVNLLPVASKIRDLRYMILPSPAVD
jgi:hypothetical protein